MKMFRTAALAALGMALAAAAHADSVTGTFMTDNGTASSTSGGTVTFTLAANGTIDATLSATNGILGFGFNSPVALGNVAESNFGPTAPSNAFGWSDLYGTQYSGFLCTQCGSFESWTIGTPGEFTSVQQAFAGTTSQYDFFLLDQQFANWGVNAVSTVPEPANVMLLLAGVGLLASRAARRKAA